MYDERLKNVYTNTRMVNYIIYALYPPQLLVYRYPSNKYPIYRKGRKLHRLTLLQVTNL